MNKVWGFALGALLLLGSGCRPESDYSLQDQNPQSADLANQVRNEGSGYLVLDPMPETEVIACPPAEIGWITDLKVYQTPDLPEPEPRRPFRDPVFGTCIVRATDRGSDLLNPDDPSLGVKNEYSRVQAFNADSSLLLVRSIEAFWYVYDARSLQPLGEAPAAVEPRWDEEDPALLYFIDETRLMSFDIRTGTLTEIHDFSRNFPGQDVAAVWTRYEGSPSYDSRYWGMLAQDSDWEPFAFLIFDMVEDVVTLREIPAGYSIDNVTISPLGNYFLASFDEYCERGQEGSAAQPCGLMVYDRNLENGRSLLRILGHYDTALDAEGREVVIYQDIDTDFISMLDLATGAVTPLLEIDFSHSALGFHFSGRGADMPGWVLVSTYNGGYPNDHTWMDDVIFALELEPGGRVVRLAHTHSLVDEDMEHDYWAEPHASVNRDFTRVVFTSNWGRTGTSEVDMYMILLPEGWMENLPEE